MRERKSLREGCNSLSLVCEMNPQHGDVHGVAKSRCCMFRWR